MNIAAASALRSEDPFCQVGACLLDYRGIVLGVGYNGTISGVEIDWEDREARRPLVIHAEANTLRYATPRNASSGILAVTHFPCAACTLLAASYGVRRIVWRHAPDWNRYPAAPIQAVAKTVGIQLTRID